jgi:hypothetical protein
MSMKLDMVKIAYLGSGNFTISLCFS